MLAIALALGASICWGSGDFLGGLTTRRASLWAVIVGSQAVGLVGATLASPPNRTGHTACSPGHPWPARTITSVAPTRPTAWLPTITAQRLARRVVRPPRKSPEPQQIDAPRARASMP